MTLSLVFLSLCTFPQTGRCDEVVHLEAEKTVLKQSPPDAEPKPVEFKTEQDGSARKLTFTFTLPATCEEGWNGFLETTRAAVVEVGKNASAVGKWLDDGFKRLDAGSRPEQIYITPLVSSAAKYCSKFHSIYIQDGRIRTVAHR